MRFVPVSEDAVGPDWVVFATFVAAADLTNVEPDANSKK
jgi:hypothetical protein